MLPPRTSEGGVPEGCNGCCPKSWISGPPLAPPNSAVPHSKLLVGPEKTCESSRIGPNWILSDAIAEAGVEVAGVAELGQVGRECRVVFETEKAGDLTDFLAI
jgi:hypothetical protein